jgi:hypothetical protein
MQQIYAWCLNLNPILNILQVYCSQPNIYCTDAKVVCYDVYCWYFILAAYIC